MIESDVRFYDILNDRTDASFYNDRFISFIDRIKSISHKPLYKLADFSSENWNQKDYFDDYFPYIEISAIDIQDGTVIGINNVEKTKAPSRAKKIVRKNDIIVSITRPNRGAICFVQNIKDIVIASTGFAVIRNINDDILREYLFIMLRQSSSLLQMEQRSSGGNYPAITEDELKKILIPLPPKEIQQQIVDLYNRAAKEKQAKEQEAKDLLASIDGYLLKELEIELPEKVSKERYYEVNAMDLIGGRIDPDFNSNSKYGYLYKSIESSKYPIKKIGEICDNVFQGVGKNETQDNTYTLLKVKNILLNNRIDYEDIEYVQSVPQNKLLKKNDILSPFIGEAIRQIKFSVFDKIGNFTIDNNTGVIRVKSNINAIYVCEYLCSILGKIQVNKLIGGGGVPFIGSHGAKKLMINTPPLEQQHKIAEHIQSIRKKTKQLQEEATKVLEKAKREVEEMIENNLY
jgi:restriction endonuclease S subunit